MKHVALMIALAGAVVGLPLVAPTAAVGQGAGKAEKDLWAGEWLAEGDAGTPCAVFRHGRVLLVVNDIGSIGSARLVEAKKIRILKGDGWDAGLTGELHDESQTIIWSNGTKWKRR